MAITVIVRFKSKPGQVANLRALLAGNQATLRRFPGFQSIALFEDLDDPTHLVEVEAWDSVSDHKTFLEQTDAAGGFDAMMELVQGEPEIYYLRNA